MIQAKLPLSTRSRIPHNTITKRQDTMGFLLVFACPANRAQNRAIAKMV